MSEVQAVLRNGAMSDVLWSNEWGRRANRQARTYLLTTKG